MVTLLLNDVLLWRVMVVRYLDDSFIMGIDADTLALTGASIPVVSPASHMASPQHTVLTSDSLACQL
jgi:hypothetical protein